MANAPKDELQVVLDFLATCLPFDELTPEELQKVARQLKIQYHRKGVQFSKDNCLPGLRILRTGAAEIRDADGQLIERLEEGESFNLQGLLFERPGITVVLIEDTLLYFFGEEDYQQLRTNHRHFDRFFHSQRSRRIRRAARSINTSPGLGRQIGSVMTTNILSVDYLDSIQNLALAMSERRVSSALVMQSGQLKGIITDRDIRSRVVAKGIDVNNAIHTVMTANPEGLLESDDVFDATLFMTNRGYHHVPVFSSEDKSKLLGIVTSSDLMLARQNEPVYLVNHIRRQKSLEGIRAICDQLPHLTQQWVNSGARAYQVSKILTAVSDAVAIRLIDMFIEEQGPAPVSFCWLGFGSQGRSEQLLGADQDNGLLISDDLKSEDEAWFEKLATRVCDGLDHCGYVYCNGNVMATNPELKKMLSGWKSNVDRWTRSPSKDAVMRVSIYFDLRCVYGDKALLDQLQAYMLKKTKGNTIFLAALADNVLDTPPPLGIFRRFVVERNGEHRDELNLKTQAIASIVDIIRIHSLANGVKSVNTSARVDELVSLKAMTIGDSRNLLDAWSVIMQIRLQEQAHQIEVGEEVNNYVNPAKLGKLKRQQLRDAFSVVSDAQGGVAQTYRPGMGR